MLVEQRSFDKLKSGLAFARIYLDHVMRVISQLRLSKSDDAEIAFPVDVFHLACKNRCGFSIDYLVNFIIFRQPFLEMD